MPQILGESDAYPDAEERRLLYVALTRARRRAIVVANDGPDSVFTRELSGSEYGRWVGCTNFPHCLHKQRAAVR